MNVKKIHHSFLLCLAVFLFLNGCSATEEEVLKETEMMVENSFTGEVKEPNTKAEHFSYFLPDGYNVESQNDTNIVLSSGKQTYILFVNLFEPLNSDEVYQTTKENTGDVVLSNTYKDDKQRFGFVFVRSLEKDQFEMSVGVGGVKVTTQSSKKEMAEHARQMMSIANSVQYEDRQAEKERKNK